jgi:MFS family permease
MCSYVRGLLALGRDIKLFLLFTLLANIGYGVFQLIFNLYLIELGYHEDDIGAFSAVQTICLAVGAATLAFMLNRFGTWRCLTAGVAFFLAVSFMLAFAENEKTLLILAVLSGLGMAYLFNPTMPFIMEWVRQDQRGHVAAVAFSVISLSITFGSLIGGYFPSVISTIAGSFEADSILAYRWTLVAGSTIALTGLIPLFLMHEPRRGRPVETKSADRIDESPTDRRRIRLDMAVFIACGGLMSLGVGMVAPFYNVYLTTLGASSRQTGYVFALGGAAAAIIGLSAPAVARRFGPLNAVLLLRSAVVPFYLLLIISPSMSVAILAFVIRQITISMAWPIDSTFIGEVLPARSRSPVFALRSAAWNLGFAGASYLAGKIIVHSGYNWTFASLLVFTLLSAGLFVGYYGRHPAVRAGHVVSAPPRRAAGAASPALRVAGQPPGHSSVSQTMD